MPQAGGQDILSVVLGDTREMLSEMLVQKADEYFHGGVKNVRCEHGLAEADHADGHEHEEGCGHEEHECADHQAAMAWNGDPWAWVNARVHEQVHRHVKGDEGKELLPWLWGACRAAPGNAQAIETTAFVLDHMNNRPMEALDLLDEGVKKNPDSASLEFSRGEVLLHSLHDAARAEAAFAAALAKCRPADGPEGDDARLLKVRTLFYLGYLAHQRGDRLRTEACLREAEAINPQHVSVKSLRKLLSGE